MYPLKEIQIFKIKFPESVGLILTIFIGILLRGFYIDQPMRFDESFTFLNYVNKNWGQVFNYTAPNNHILNTILIKLSTTVWGGHPFVIRLPALIFGISSIPLIYLICRNLGSKGYIAALILAVHPYLILFSTNARGYSAIVFFTLLFIYISIIFTKNVNKKIIFILALIGSLGLLSLPIMLFPLCGLTLWLVFLLLEDNQNVSQIIYKFLFPYIVMGLIISIIFYSPVVWFTMQPHDSLIEALDMIFNNEFVKSSQGMYFFGTIRAHITNAIFIYLKDIPKPLVVLFFIFMIFGFIADYQERTYRITILVLSVCLSTFILFILKQQIPYPRTWIFLIPIFSILADRGFSFIIKILKLNIFLCVFVIILLSVYWSFSIVAKKSVYTYADTGTYLDAQIMAKKMHSILNADDEVIAPIIPSNLPIYFYLWHENFYNKPLIKNEEKKSTYIIIPSDEIRLEMFSLPPHPINTNLEIVHEENVEKIFEFNGSVIYKTKSITNN